MEFLIAWLITILISLGMEKKFSNHLLKDLHNNGYKLILKTEGRNNKKVNKNLKKNVDLIQYIPFLNLMFQLKLAYNYILHKEEFINMYISNELIEEMTKEEFKKFKNYKNYNKAMYELYKNSIKINNIQLDDGSNISFYYPTEDERFDNIVITNVTGPAKNLSDEEIKLEIEKKIKKDIKKLLVTKEESNKATKNNNDFEQEQDINKTNFNKEKEKTLTKKINRK